MGLTLGLGLGQSKDIVEVIISLQQTEIDRKQACDLNIGLEESRGVWKDLGSRRIRKSLEREIGLEVTSRDKGFSWCTHSIYMYLEIKSDDIGQWSKVEGMMSGHMQEAWWPYGKHMWMSNRT